MALLAWLPLINNIQNNGIANIETSSIGNVTFNNTGKTGVGSFKSGNEGSTTSSDGISINSNFVDDFGDTASVAAWVMPLGDHGHYNGTIVTSGNWNGKKWAFGVSKDNSKVDVLCGNYNTYINCTVPVNEWTHLCSTYDNGVSKLYKNGEYIGELTGAQIKPFESDATNTMIGRATYGKYFGFYGSINDVRIYNHVLSPKEVKEISQGLICHYKLDNGGCGNPNLIMPLYYQSSPWKTAIKEWVYYEGKRTMIVSANTLYSNTSAGTTSLFPEITFKENTQYTISVDWRDDYRTDGKNTSLYLRFKYTDGSTATQIISPATSKTEWTHSKLTSSSGKTVSMVSTTYGNGGYTYVANLKIEEGATETAFEPFGVLNADDSSGYGRNGVINGSLPIVYDTPRNTVSTYFSGSPNRIVGSYYATDTMTFSVWVNFRGGMAGSYHVIDGRDTSSNGYQPIYITSTTIQAGSSHGYINFNYTWATRKWYHIVITQDSTGCYFYVNGDQVNSATAAAYHGYGFNMELPLTVGARMNYSNHAVVYLSDLRVYATALSPDDIKELYEVSASIDDKGNAHAYEIVEDEDSRELLADWNTLSYSNNSGKWQNFTADGEWYFDATGTSTGTPHISISPTGKTYYYDIIVSKDAGNQVYIGFEKYDADKTPRSNNACVYVMSDKTNAYDHRRFFGTVNLATDGVNPTATIRLRVLNGWSSTSGTMTIHSMSLREVDTATGIETAHIIKTGILLADEVREYDGNARFDKNGFADAQSFIEK